MTIQIAQTDTQIIACFAVMQQLRPHLHSPEDFLAQVQRQIQHHGYTLAYLSQHGHVLAAAGFRVAEYLAWGRTFYVDDLITASQARKQGLGGQLLDWLIAHARELNCQQFHLDSGVQRFDAHRLYLGRKMKISSHHFSLGLVAE